MAADYAGAVAAIRSRFVDRWAPTPIAYQNETFQQPVDVDTGDVLPWVFLEVLGTQSQAYATGVPGNRVWLYEGLVHVHVFVPVNKGAALGQQLAVEAGEIFRDAVFYEDGAGAYVRTRSPQTDGGGSDADNGDYWRVTMTCGFEYFHHA